MSDIRIIWGGDYTVEEIRKSRIQPRCVEVVFADRESACVIYAEKVLEIEDWNEVAQKFYNDTYLYDQNACSSPHLIYWIGKEEAVIQAKLLFWDMMHKQILQKYKIEPIIAIDKLTMACKAAIEKENIKIIFDKDNLICRMELATLDADSLHYSCPGGSYLEYQSEKIQDLEVVITKKFQTLSYLGGNGKELADWVIERGLEGVDRIVPMGKTADFTLIWDGYNLVEEMSRKVYFV